MTSLNLKRIEVLMVFFFFLVHACSCISEFICVSTHMHLYEGQRLASDVNLQVIALLVSFRESLTSLWLASSRLAV